MTGELWLISAGILLLSFFTTIFLTPLTRKFALKLKTSDRKDKRTVHTKVVTRMGGAAIYAGILISLLMLYSWGILRLEILAVVSGSVIIFLIGIRDDLKEIPSYLKFIGQIAACLVVIQYGFMINMFTIPFFQLSIKLPLAASYILTILWILLITNAVNFIDGLDGLAAGIMAIVCLFLFGISIRTGRTELAIPFLAVAGSCTGFLRYNFHPAKVFMGDAGSTSIGFAVGCMTLFGTIKAPAVFPLLIPLVALGIPAADVCLAVLRRLKNKKSPFAPDKKHLHHKLLETGLPHKDAVLIMYGVTIMLGIIALNFSPHPSLSTLAFAFITIGVILVAIKRIAAGRNA